MRIRTTLSLVVVAALTGACIPSTAVAQGQSLPVNLPDGPAKDGFDIERFSNLGNGWFETLYVERTEALQDVLQQGCVATDTPGPRARDSRRPAGPGERPDGLSPHRPGPGG